MSAPVKKYYELTKSGLVFGNLIPVLAGFKLAAGAAVDWVRLIATLVGMALIMAAGCVFNNYIDRDIDAVMPRTKGRALVTAEISPRAALLFGGVLGGAGFLILGLYTNGLTLGLALFGFFAYVGLYSLVCKRRFTWGTFVGALAGSVPPVVGYCAVSGQLDVVAAALFAILFFWQIPHFFAIAIRRAADYDAAGVPVLPVARGTRTAKIYMLICIGAFTFAACGLAGVAGLDLWYSATAAVLGLGWLGFSVRGFFLAGAAEAKWARTMFFVSLAVITLLFATLALVA